MCAGDFAVQLLNSHVPSQPETTLLLGKSLWQLEKQKWLQPQGMHHLQQKMLR